MNYYVSTKTKTPIAIDSFMDTEKNELVRQCTVTSATAFIGKGQSILLFAGKIRQHGGYATHFHTTSHK